MSLSSFSSMGYYVGGSSVPAPPTTLDTFYSQSYFSFNAENYNAGTKTFTDLSPNGRNKTFSTGSPTIVSHTTVVNSFTTSKTYNVVSGTKTDKCVLFPSLFGPYTFIAVSRRTDGNGSGSLFNDPNTSWIAGYWSNWSGVAQHTSSFIAGATSDRYGTNMWLMTDYNTGFRRNGALLGTSNNLSIPINSGINCYSSGGQNFNIAEILCFNSTLSTANMASIETLLATKYGINLNS